MIKYMVCAYGAEEYVELESCGYAAETKGNII
jgi:hypothetical protein